MRFDITDNVIIRALTKICDMVCLNVLWLICCIPIITIGASTTALYTIMLKMVKNEEGYIFRSFFKAFKENFKQSTIIWIILLALGIICCLDYRLAGMMPETAGFVMRSFFLLIAFFSAVCVDLCICAYCQVRERYKGNVPECTYPDNRKTSIYTAHGCCDSGSGCCVSVEFSHAGVCNSAVASDWRGSDRMDQLVPVEKGVPYI